MTKYVDSLDQNIKFAPGQLARIKRLTDFDLTMLLSEINDHGWEDALKILPFMSETHGWNESGEDE